MNTTNIPLTAWNSMGISSGTAGTMQQSSIGGANSGGSVFQQMIAQLTAMNNQSGGSTQGDLLATENSGASGKTGALMELLFSGESADTAGILQGEGQSELKEENSELEILLALMSGLPAAAMPSNSEHTDSKEGTQAAGLSLLNGDVPLSETIPASLSNLLGSLELVQGQGQGVDFRAGALYAQTAEAGETANTLKQTAQSSEGVSMAAGELLSAVSGSAENKAGRNGVPILMKDGLAVEESAGLVNLQDHGETEAFDLSSLKRDEQKTGSLSSGMAADDIATVNPSGDGKNVQADELKSDGAGQTSSAQEYLNSIHYTDSVKESGILNQSVQTSGKAEQYSQISDEILSRLEQKNSNEFRMQLQPEDLGQIDIKLKLNEGRLIIDIMAANAKTQTLLTSQVDKLIASMGLQNVQVESVQVSQQMNQQSSGGQSQWQSMNFGMDFSQQRNQEQLHKETHREGSLTGSSRTSQTEVQETIPAMIQNLRQVNLHRLNYSV